VDAAIDRGATDVASIGRQCGAGTDCCGCHPTLEALLADRLVSVPAAGDARRLAVIAA
jgi:bacterioferritin-associated ferredoxin